MRDKEGDGGAGGPATVGETLLGEGSKGGSLSLLVGKHT